MPYDPANPPEESARPQAAEPTTWAAAANPWDPWDSGHPAGLRPWSLWRRCWTRRSTLGGWSLQLSTFTLLSILCSVGYLAVVNWNAWRGLTVWDPRLAWDGRIPALGWTILPYFSYYLYFPLGFILTPRNARGAHALLFLNQALLWIGAIAGCVFLILPCRVTLLDELPAALLAGEDLWGQLFALMHRIDKPFNAWPSLHVAFSLCIVIYVMDLWRGMHKTMQRILLWSAWVLLTLSILTTKQHFLFDLFSGALLGAWGGLVYLRPRARRLLADANSFSSEFRSPS